VLPRKDHAVAGEPGIDRARDAVTAAIAEVGDDIGAGVLVEGVVEVRVLPAAHRQVQPGRNLAQTADFEHAGERAGSGIEALVDDKRVQFVGEMARGAIVLLC
jgi:hypothetical protein